MQDAWDVCLVLVVCRIQRWWRQNPNHPEATCVRLSNDLIEIRWWDYWPAAGEMCWKWTWLHWALQPALLSARPGPFWLRKSMEFDSRCYCSDAPLLKSLLLHVSWQKLQIDKLTQDQALTNESLTRLLDYLTISDYLSSEHRGACAAASAAQWQLAVHLVALPCRALKLGNMAWPAKQLRLRKLPLSSMMCKQCNLFGFECRVQGTIQRSLRVSAWTFGCLHFTYYNILEGLVRYQVVFSTSLNSLSRSSRGIISFKW